MKATFIVLILGASALSFAQEEILREETFQNAWGAPVEELLEQPAPEESLFAVVKHLKYVTPDHFQLHYHVNRISKHAALIQQGEEEMSEEDKAKAYAHDFAASKNAIKAALGSLTDQLNAGHTHDQQAITQSKSTNEGTLTTAQNNAQKTATDKKHEVCPHKRAEETAHANKQAKEAAMKKVQSDKVCEPNIDFTYTDMDVEKVQPKFGTALRNAWDQARARFASAKTAYDAATVAHTNAVQTTNTALATFKTALGLSADNAHSTCNEAHSEYNTLKTEVANNVAARKQVYRATLVVMCYVDHLGDNAKAKECADSAHTADVSKWNITPGALTACEAASELKKKWGPEDWTPSMDGCAQHRAIVAEKERATKEAAEKATERDNKEKNTKELATKEVAAKAKVEADRVAAVKESQEKADVAKAKEATDKEHNAKEGASKESAHKAQFMPAGSCCVFLHGCHDCCNRCPGGNHHVWPHTCLSSRRCN